VRYNDSVERHERDFKGVWIPREVWLSNELSLMEKVLFVEIHSLDNENGCYASNGYFAEFFDVSDRQIRNVIGALKSKGFITVSVKNKNERTIRVTGKFAYPNSTERRKLRMDMERLSEGMRYTSQRRTVDKWRGVAEGVGRKFPGR
jgi:hypothetical protein